MQERVESGTFESFIEHKLSVTDHFVVNLTAFHNAHLIREALPREVTQPIALYHGQDRAMKHREIAERLRTAQDGKRATIQQNREAQREATAAAQQAGVQPQGDENMERSEHIDEERGRKRRRTDV